MDSINLCYEMCDYIEQNGVVKLVGNVKLRDNLKKELLHFLIYISMTDGRYGEEEKAFIKKKLGFDVSASMAADIKNRNMLGAGYITRVPETFKYFILANAATYNNYICCICHNYTSLLSSASLPRILISVGLIGALLVAGSSVAGDTPNSLATIPLTSFAQVCP